MGKSKRIISTLNLKSNSFGDSVPLNRSLTVDEFESNLTSLGDGINNVAAELEHSAAIVARSLSTLESNMLESKTEIKLDVKRKISELSAKSIKMIGSYKGLNLNPEEGEEQYIEFDEEGYYLITDILLTNSSGAVESASGGIFTSESMLIVAGKEIEGAERSASIVAITSDYMNRLAAAPTAEHTGISQLVVNGGLSSLVDPTNFINTIVGGGSSEFQVNRASLSASPGVSLISNSLVENGVYFNLSSPEGSDLTCDVYVFGFKINISTAEETTTTTTEAEETTTTTTEKGKDGETTTTTTANSAVTVSFLNQDSEGPITWEDIEILPIIEFYSVTSAQAMLSATKLDTYADAKESKSRFTLTALDSGIFNGDGTYQFNVSYSSANDIDGKGTNTFGYKVYNRSTISYEKTDLIWYGLFSLSSDGTIYEIDGNGESLYDGVIARPIPTSATVSTHLIGYGDADLENVTIYYTKPYSEIDMVFGIEKSRSVFGVTDASGIVSATVSFVSDRIILISDEFNDSSSSITYVSNETNALLSTLSDGVVQVDFYLDPKPIEFDITSYYGTGIQVNRVILGDDGTIDWNLSTQLSDFGVFDKGTDSWNVDNGTFAINPNQPGNYRVLIFEMVQSGEEMSQNVVYEDVIYANFGDVYEVNVIGNIGNVSYTLSDNHITPYVDATYTLQSMYYSHDSGSTVAGPYFDVNVESGLVTNVAWSKVPYQLNLQSHVGQEFRILGGSFGEGYTNANDDIIITVNSIGTFVS